MLISATLVNNNVEIGDLVVYNNMPCFVAKTSSGDVLVLDCETFRSKCEFESIQELRKNCVLVCKGADLKIIRASATRDKVV